MREVGVVPPAAMTRAHRTRQQEGRRDADRTTEFRSQRRLATAAGSSGFQMPSSMMPGMQTGGDKRLRVELYIRNISSSPQRYALNGFRLFGTGGRSWAPLDNAATRGAVLSALLDPGFLATVDLYFDLPASQGNRLSLEWEHGGTTVTFPVHVIGSDSGVMVGM